MYDSIGSTDVTCGSASVLQDNTAWHYLKFGITGVGTPANPLLTLSKEGFLGTEYTVGAITASEYSATTDGAGAEVSAPSVNPLGTFSFGGGATSVSVPLSTNILNYKEGGYLYLRIAPPSGGGVQVYFCRASSSKPPTMALM